MWGKLGQKWTPPLAYPERLGVWPAAFLLFCFAALELAYAEPASPRALALAIALYSYVAWFGMAAYGRRTWTERGEAFTVYFGLLARIAPFGEREGRLIVRVPFSGLAGREATAGMLAFIAVMLGSVGFDGFSRSPIWQDLRARLEGPYMLDAPGTAELIATGLALAGLVGCILLVALAYLGAIRVAHAVVGDERPLAPEFLLRPGSDRARLRGRALLHPARDPGPVRDQRSPRIPFGFGWDLFGTAGLHAEHRTVRAQHRLVRAGRPRSSAATSPASRSPTTARSRSSRTATHCVLSTPCWR